MYYYSIQLGTVPFDQIMGIKLMKQQCKLKEYL